MTIRFNKDYNRKIRNQVSNFAKKRNRAIKNGYKNVPPALTVKELKSLYTSRHELDRQLKLMSSFSARRSALESVEMSGGVKAIPWEVKYLKSNAKAAREFFVRQYNLILPKTRNMPGERMRLDALANKIKLLDLDLAYLDQSQFRTYRSTINEFLNSAGKTARSYRGFLSEVDYVMKMLGFPEKQITGFFDKFKVLSPDQFLKLYEKSSLISRVYDLADSPAYGNIKLNTSETDAKDLIDTLMDEVDDLIVEAQKEEKIDEEFQIDRSIEFYRNFAANKPKVRTKEGKIPLSSLDKEDVKRLKELGWDDLIDEKQ